MPELKTRRKHTPASAVFTDVLRASFRLNAKLEVAGDRMSRPYGLSASRWQVMGLVADQAKTVPQIAQEMAISRQNVLRLVRMLVTGKMVELQDNPRHLRAKFVALTPKGVETLGRVRDRQIVWAKDISARIGTRDLAATLRFMKKLDTLLR